MCVCVYIYIYIYIYIYVCVCVCVCVCQQEYIFQNEYNKSLKCSACVGRTT